MVGPLLATFSDMHLCVPKNDVELPRKHSYYNLSEIPETAPAEDDQYYLILTMQWTQNV